MCDRGSADKDLPEEEPDDPGIKVGGSRERALRAVYRRRFGPDYEQIFLDDPINFRKRRSHQQKPELEAKKLARSSAKPRAISHKD